MRYGCTWTMQPLQAAPVERVVRLEEWAKLSEARMSRMEDKLDQIIRRLAAIPTRIDLLGAFVAALAVLSIVFAGLGWLETRAARTTPASAPVPPIVIQLPAASTPSTPARR